MDFMHMPDPRRFLLSKPIQVILSGAHGPRREETIEQVSLRPLTVKDLQLLDRYRGQPMYLVARAVATLSGLTFVQVNRIDLADYQPVAAAALRLLTEASNSVGLPSGWFMEKSPIGPVDN